MWILIIGPLQLLIQRPLNLPVRSTAGLQLPSELPDAAAAGVPLRRWGTNRLVVRNTLEK